MRISIRRSVPVALMAIGLSGCARDSRDASDGGVPTAPGPAATPLKISAVCRGGPYQAGQYVPLACTILVDEATNPASTGTTAFADTQLFNGSRESSLPACPACGAPPRTFDLDLRVPADLAPGVKTFAVWATDAQGRRADSTASIEIAAR